MNAIEIKNLSKHYKDFSLDNINMVLPTGSILGLVGENGAGKSTTINIIMSALKGDSGEVTVLGVNNESSEFYKTKQDIGIVLDECCFPEANTAKNIDKIMKVTFTNWSEETFFKYLSTFKLPRSKKIKDFSRGMKMKLSIAVALSHDAKLLVLDEATSGLDPMVRDEILDIFNDFTRDPEHSILISSHIVSDLEKICDYIGFIHNGKLLFCEEKDKLIENYAIIKLSNEELKSISEKAIISTKDTSYGVEALIIKSEIPSTFKTEHTSLEDIILFFARKEAR